jgi:hypothetical protein
MLCGFVATRERALLFRQRLIPVVLGYDDDPRELRDIPEVRAFIQAVFRECPFLFFLAHPTGNLVRILAECHCATGGETHGIVELDTELLREFFDRGFVGLNELTYRLAISSEENKVISDAVFEIFRGALARQ